ncbi:hypothetical protein [Metallosphaera sp.]|uniref:hypothetical protein n=1 Tax=Metallosphaera sp. TaxID=2020860 RepID=UPI003166DED1
MNKVIVIGIIAIAVILISLLGFMSLNVNRSSNVQYARVNLQTAPSSQVLLSPVQVQASTGLSSYVVGSWIEVSNLSGLFPTQSGTSNQPQLSLFFNNLSKIVGITYAEVLIHNSTSTATLLVSKISSQNVTNDFRRLALVLVAGYNFNVNKSGNFEYVYGNISNTGLALGYDGKYFVASVVTGSNNLDQSALSLLLNQYQTAVSSQLPLVQPPSIFQAVSNMKQVLWAYVNFTALRSVNISGYSTHLNYNNFANMNGLNAGLMREYNNTRILMNVSTGYLTLYANDSSLLLIEVTQYNTQSQAMNQYNSTLRFYQSLHNLTGQNYVVSQGVENNAPYFIVNPNPFNNNTLILVANSGSYLISETNYAKVASQSLLLNYLQGLLSQL